MRWSALSSSPGGLIRRHSDLTICITLFLVGLMVSMTYMASWGRREMNFYQFTFGPAVMVALGKGFVNPDREQIPALADFLACKTESLDESSLPEEIPTISDFGRWNVYQEAERYLMHVVGWTWRVFGISWAALAPLFGLLFATTLVVTYGLFRLAMGRFWAVALATVMLFSPIHLLVLPLMRDYSKAPFFLAAILILGYLVKRRTERTGLWGLCAVLGAVIGVSLGFRRDMIVCVPASFVVLLFLLPGNFRQEYRRRIVGVMLVVLCTVVCGWPILGTASRKGSDSSHVMLLGLSVPYTNNLGIESDLYDFGHMANLDSAVHAIVSSYASRELNYHKLLHEPSPEYEWACSQYCLALAKAFPADMLLRWYASVLHVLNYAPFNLQSEGAPYIHTNTFLETLLNWRLKWFSFLQGNGVYLAIVALVLLAGRSLRYSIAVSFFVMFFAGYACLQFNIRHFFHLEFMPWCVAGFLAQQVSGSLWWLRLGVNRIQLRTVLREPVHWCTPALLRIMGTLVVGGLAVFLPLKTIQLYQDHTVGALLARCHNADLTRLDTVTEPLQDWPGWALYKPCDFMAPESWAGKETASHVHTGYLVAEFGGGAGHFEAKFVFNCESKLSDVGRTMDIDLPDDASTTRVFFPVFSCTPGGENQWKHLAGVAVRQEYASRLQHLYRVENLADFPLMLTIRLEPGWERAPRHMVFDRALLPFYARAALASVENLAPCGSFESWSANGVPEGFSIPTSRSTISREMKCVAAGKSAVRQTWTANDTSGSFYDRFGIKLTGLEPLTDYEFFFKARNSSPGHVAGVYIWETIQNPDGTSAFANLHNEHHSSVLPSPGHFVEYSARFTTRAARDGTVLIFTSCATDATHFPNSVVWDDWRLLKLGTRSHRDGS